MSDGVVVRHLCVLFLLVFVCFFFFKQKTAYEMLRSLVGSEMCIRDSYKIAAEVVEEWGKPLAFHGGEMWSFTQAEGWLVVTNQTVSYTHLTLPTIYSV